LEQYDIRIASFSALISEAQILARHVGFRESLYDNAYNPDAKIVLIVDKFVQDIARRFGQNLENFTFYMGECVIIEHKIHSFQGASVELNTRLLVLERGHDITGELCDILFINKTLDILN